MIERGKLNRSYSSSFLGRNFRIFLQIFFGGWSKTIGYKGIEDHSEYIKLF